MIYALSDLHGCYDKYIKMLDKLQLQETDILYVLGDVVDRGPDGIKIILDMKERKNVILLCGNHDDTALNILRCMFDPAAEFNEDELVPMLKMWTSDGGDTTLKGFMELKQADKKAVLAYLSQAKPFVELKLGGTDYLLAHTVPEKELMLEKEKLELEDYIWGEPDYELQYYDDKIIVTGHTPTWLIEEAYKGRIYIKNHHIAVDCGACFPSGRLGCICLDTMEEYYV